MEHVLIRSSNTLVECADKEWAERSCNKWDIMPINSVKNMIKDPYLNSDLPEIQLLLQDQLDLKASNYKLRWREAKLCTGCERAILMITLKTLNDTINMLTNRIITLEDRVK